MPHTPQPMNPPESHSGQLRRVGSPLRLSRAAAVGGSIFLAALGVSVPSKPNQAGPLTMGSSQEPYFLASTELDSPGLGPMIGLGVGLAGPPLLGRDGSWWLLGSDGEIGHFRGDDHLIWSISVGSTITGAAVADEQGLLFVPTARDLVYAVEPSGHQRWRFRAPAGISGPLGWMAGQGVVFVGRDRALYWLDQRANLLLRAPLGSRVSVGPAPLGARAVVGTEMGQLIALTRQGKRQSVQIGAPIAAILPTNAGIVALAADKAVGLDAQLNRVWSREHVLGIGVTSSLGQGQRLGSPVVLQASGQMDWLDAAGETVASVTLGRTLPSEPIPVFAATNSCAWISFDSGVLWEVCVNKAVKNIPLARASLTRPIIDLMGARVMVGSAVGGLWSLPLAAGS